MPDIQIRSVPPVVRARFTDGASLRGLTLAAYLERLLDLRERIAAKAQKDGAVWNVLHELGLESVSKSA